jgi:anti-sigma B factor antagonist
MPCVPDALDTPRPGEALRVEAETYPLMGVVRLAGELDLAGAARVTAAVERLAGRGEAVVLDLRDVTFIDSTGVRTLLDVERGADGPVALLAPSPAVLRVLELTQLRGRFAEIEDLEDETIESLERRDI